MPRWAWVLTHQHPQPAYLPKALALATAPAGTPQALSADQALFAYANSHTSLAPLGASLFGERLDLGWIWLYLYCADVTPSYFQPGCHGNHKASALVRSSIYNLLTPPSPQPHPKETGA